MLDASISKIVLRARMTFSLLVWTFMLLAALTMQAGWSTRWPSTSTTQISKRVRRRRFMEADRGDVNPTLARSFKQGLPSSALISFPSIDNVIVISSP